MVRSMLLAAAAAAALWGGEARAACAANGQIFGVIEIGGKGIKGTLSKIVSSPQTGPDACDLKVLAELEPYNTDPVDSKRTPETLNSIKALQHDLIEKALELKVDLPDGHLFFVLSSGMKDRAKDLESKIVSRTGVEPSIVSAQDEASLTFDAVASIDRCRDREKDVIIDVGSSNTKGAYLIPDANLDCNRPNPELQHETFDIPFGTVTAEKRAEELRHRNSREESYEMALERLLTGEVDPSLAKVVDGEGDGHIGFARLNRVYLAGGIVYALATFAHPQDRGAQVVLSAEDIDDFYSDLRDRPDCIEKFLDESVSRAKCRLKSALKLVKDEKTRAQVSDEIDRILQRTFPEREQLLAGAGLVRSLSHEWDFKHRKVTFMRQALNAWMLGYLMQKLGNRADLPRQIMPVAPTPHG
jgi:hypothetical protein